ncbi:hypothetical protein [Glutamicibacter nicotianae]|uniref:hypothetical protein n=1 Tax=Glutamicibacter nicotianae TaxID=37929 RepID=UPI00255525C0|nr:hypothetical protein [Glutamicibacter nicotianae]WIV44158.1 hypothetical protein QQS42_00615 [Glutamicibacter nicotianae]
MSDFDEKGFQYAPLHGEYESGTFPVLPHEMTSNLKALSIAAVCDIVETLTDNLRPSISVKITQCILMSDGSMISLDLDRGFTAIYHGPGPARWRRSSDELIAEILDLVRVDDPVKPGEHPWDEIAAAAQNRGIDIDAAKLKALPYQVMLSDKVIRTFEI